MKIRELKVAEANEIQTTIYECPYCSKRFLNKGSYRNHIDKKYCHSFYIDYEIKTQEYEEGKITQEEYYMWCYEKGYAEFLNIDEATREKLGNDFFEKLCSLYNYSEDYS